MADPGLRTAGFYSLFSKFNKAKPKNQDDKPEGLVEEFNELTLDMTDDELKSQRKDWELSWSGSEVKKRINDAGDINVRYWIGKQYPDSEYEGGKRPLTDNIIFEGFETLVAQTPQQNPEPVIMTDNSVEMKQIGDKIHMALEFLANRNFLKETLKKGVRQWGLRFVGIWQIGWDDKEKEIVIQVKNPKDIIMDPNGYIENGKYYGEFLGVKMNDSAANLALRFPEKEVEIKKEAKNKMGSLMNYTQWWDGEGKYLFYTLKDIVLGSHKNPNWNYEQETTTVDDLGAQIPKIEPGKNHFNNPEIPFVFLTVFDLGDEPADKTNLIQQGLVTQDNINKSLKQFDRNVDKLNGGIAVNGDNMSKEQAAQISEAHRNGRTIVTPGNPNETIMQLDNKALPDALVQRLDDQRNRFLQRFGVAGSTSGSSQQEETVRGKIIAGNNDNSRTGGGVIDFLEVAASRVFNQWVQMIYVYYDTPHLISVIGPDNASQMATLENAELPIDRKIFVAVQNGSMVPQDELSIYNEAMGEFEAGVLDPLSYFEKTKDPNPQERAERLMVYKTNPVLYMQQYLQIAPPPVAQPGAPVPPTTTTGQPGAAINEPPTAPTPIGAEEHNIISQVPIK